MAERLKIFNENYEYVGDESRDTVHEKGLWHETFHCWLVDDTNVFIQKRSAAKKDFPGMYDITAAGHLLADEDVMDGIREVEEELGIEVELEKLERISVLKDVITLPSFIDKEFANIFLYKGSFSPGDFKLQKEEVESIHPVPLKELQSLFRGEVATITCGNGMSITLADFVPHETEYFNAIAEMLVL